ncbi:MAG TPA: NHL repeat-containing protein [Gemmatimonadaceae bacterium]|nr:NHL repeat-containing protein [Gemmatimonadaceae bacterium]
MKLSTLSMLLLLTSAQFGHPSPCTLCLYGPDNMAFDTAGNVYLVDTDHKARSRVLKLSPDGRVLADWHVFDSASGRNNGPDGIALDREGNIFVVDRGGVQILKLSPAGRVLARFRGFPSRAFDFGGHVAIDTQGAIYGVAAASNLILKFSPHGNVVATWHRAQGPGLDQWHNPETISLDNEGNLVIADWGNVRILTLSPNGHTVRAFAAVPNEPLNVSSVSGAVVGPDGSIYVADYQLLRVQEFNSHGRLLATIGNTAGNTLFEKAPNSIAIDRQGVLYATDGLTVVKFSRDGKLLARWQ